MVWNCRLCGKFIYVMKTLLQLKTVIRESTCPRSLFSSDAASSELHLIEQELPPLVADEADDLKAKYFACLDEKSWLAARYLDLQERYERLLINYNRLSDPHSRS